MHHYRGHYFSSIVGCAIGYVVSIYTFSTDKLMSIVLFVLSTLLLYMGSKNRKRKNLFNPVVLYIYGNEQEGFVVRYYQFRYSIQNLNTMIQLPERDMNNLVVPEFVRTSLLEYLKKEKAKLFDSSITNIISVEDSQKTMTNFQLGNNTEKNFFMKWKIL